MLFDILQQSNMARKKRFALSVRKVLWHNLYISKDWGLGVPARAMRDYLYGVGH